jgi:hypothetical protein
VRFVLLLPTRTTARLAAPISHVSFAKMLPSRFVSLAGGWIPNCGDEVASKAVTNESSRLMSSRAPGRSLKLKDVVWRLSSTDDWSLSSKCKVQRYKRLGRGESGVLLRASRFVFHVTQKSVLLAKFHFRPPRHVNLNAFSNIYAFGMSFIFSNYPFPAYWTHGTNVSIARILRKETSPSSSILELTSSVRQGQHEQSHGRCARCARGNDNLLETNVAARWHYRKKIKLQKRCSIHHTECST